MGGAYRKVTFRVAVTMQALLASLFLFPLTSEAFISGIVVDHFSRRPIQGAVVVADGGATTTDEKGMFVIQAVSDRVTARAHGYLRAEEQALPLPASAALTLELVPFNPKALYLSHYGIGARQLRESALRLVAETELNALVIDVKGDRGWISFPSTAPLAAEIGALKVVTIRDARALVNSLRSRGIYLIARIVVFKDNPLASARPELAVTKAGRIWRDHEDLAWSDPFRKEVWDYNIGIALEAAQAGFDEIQFDYVRFPEAHGLTFSRANTEENRVKAISGFLAEARRRLTPYNVFVAADIYGYVCWNLGDTDIGQRLSDIAAVVDYVCPMLYPSGFQYGIPGFRNPVAHPYETVYLSLKRARERIFLPSYRFRPWLQAFRDYAFDRRRFTGSEIRAQINAAEKFGSHGWMLWNPQNIYSGEGLKKEGQKG